jgi:hypothetical protein
MNVAGKNNSAHNYTTNSFSVEVFFSIQFRMLSRCGPPAIEMRTVPPKKDPARLTTGTASDNLMINEDMNCLQ